MSKSIKNQKQLFFSHTWKLDKLNRNTHYRVATLVRGLQKLGWGTWFDQDDMLGNIDAAMARGIDNCECVIVCITEQYCHKVNNAAYNPKTRDNCHKEWNYANNRDKLMIPVIMEPDLLNTTSWPPGVVPLHLSSTLYIDASSNDLWKAILALNKMLLNYKLVPKIPVKRFTLRKKLYRNSFSHSERFLTKHLLRTRSGSLPIEIRI